MENLERKLHWTQRLALIRHNLTSALRTRSFTFFRTFQAHALISGTDHVARLRATLGDEADALICTLDKSNAVIACVYEDAYKTVYDNVKDAAESNSCAEGRRSMYHINSGKQLQLAATAVDKMIDLAVTLIHQQPAESQEDAATVFAIGTSFIADAVEVCIGQITALEGIMDDPVRMETSLSLVQSTVASSISAMKGVFSLMNNESPEGFQISQPGHHRCASIDSYARGMLRRMSNVLSSSSSEHLSAAASRKQSINSDISRRSSVVSVVSPRRSYFSTSSNPILPSPAQAVCPVAIGGTHTLSPIPPTPAASASEVLTNPFECVNFNSGVFRQNSSYSPVPPDKPSARRDSVAVSPTDANIPTPETTPVQSPEAPTPVRPSLQNTTLPAYQSVGSSVSDFAIYETDPMNGSSQEGGNSPGLLQRMSRMLQAAPAVAS